MLGRCGLGLALAHVVGRVDPALADDVGIVDPMLAREVGLPHVAKYCNTKCKKPAAQWRR